MAYGISLIAYGAQPSAICHPLSAICYRPDDEDEGSPLRDGANGSRGYKTLPRSSVGAVCKRDMPENRKFSGSPPGQPPPTLFPSKKKSRSTTHAGNCADRTKRRGKAADSE